LVSSYPLRLVLNFPYDGKVVGEHIEDAVLDHGHVFYNGYGSNTGEFIRIHSRVPGGNIYEGVNDEGSLQVAAGNSATAARANVYISRPNVVRRAYENRVASVSAGCYIVY